MGSGKERRGMANHKISPEAEDDLYRIWFYGLEHWALQSDSNPGRPFDRSNVNGWML